MTDTEFDGQLVWASSFETADELSGILKPYFLKRAEDQKNKLSGMEMRIADTNALFLLACLMNSEVLDQDFLNQSLDACKRAMKQFIEQSQVSANQVN